MKDGKHVIMATVWSARAFLIVFTCVLMVLSALPLRVSARTIEDDPTRSPDCTIQPRAQSMTPNIEFRIPASTFGIAFWDGIIPHYGARFETPQILCRAPEYLGPGGYGSTCGSGSGCIDTWNWWNVNVLLVPKTWIYSDFTTGQQTTVPSNYRATCTF